MELKATENIKDLVICLILNIYKAEVICPVKVSKKRIGKELYEYTVEIYLHDDNFSPYFFIGQYKNDDQFLYYFNEELKQNNLKDTSFFKLIKR